MLVTAGVLVGVGALILTLVSLFRTLVSIGVSLAVILVAAAAAFYFLPDVAGPLAGEALGMLDYFLDALRWVLEAF